MKNLPTRSIDFIDIAPAKVHKSFELACSATTFWKLLLDTPSWPQWFPAMKECRNLDDQMGKGSQRYVHLDNFKVVEKFIAWEEEKEWGFYVKEINVPILKAMVEHVTLETIEVNRIQVTWRIGAELKPWVRFAQSFLVKDLNKSFDAMIQVLTSKFSR